MIKKVLFVVSPVEDYLSVTLFHGLRFLYGGNVVDWPRYEVAYDDYPVALRNQVYGRGFTAFYNLQNIKVTRSNIEERLAAGEFELVIISDIWRNFELFESWRKYLNPRNTILVDGNDSPQVYPHAGYWWRRPYYWFIPHAAGFLYFKREWTEKSQFNLWHRLLPAALLRALPAHGRLRRIAFSIPEGKIVGAVPGKGKDFSRHVVDPEVAARLPGSSTAYAFASEGEYYRDLQVSRFGITMRRSGWDCLRHYEIAANGCVPCFRDLGKKPANCAPHGLVPGVNSISYSNVDDLLNTTSRMGRDEYAKLAEGALQWARMNSSAQRARQIIQTWKED